MPRFSAIILAAGSGTRMGGDLPKQYQLLGNKPMMLHSIETFLSEEAGMDEVVLVIPKGDEDYVRQEILEKYGVRSNLIFAEGGSERSESVLNGVRAASGEFVFIHDSARPLIDFDVIHRVLEDTITFDAAIAAVPAKDTMKVQDENQMVESTLDRSKLWAIQTPQGFQRQLILDAYDKVLAEGHDMKSLTDDAMVVEAGTGHKVKLSLGSDWNFKVTTGVDYQLADTYLKNR